MSDSPLPFPVPAAMSVPLLRSLKDHGPVLATVWGSRLYGLDRPDSDYDYALVVPEPRWLDGHASHHPFQQVTTTTGADGTKTTYDVTVYSLNVFLTQVAAAERQALEVLYSPTPLVDVLGARFRFGYRVDPVTARNSYHRYVHHALTSARLDERHGRELSALKRRRHATRAVLNLSTLLHAGLFNPTLSARERDTVSKVAAAALFPDALVALSHRVLPLWAALDVDRVHDIWFTDHETSEALSSLIREPSS